ncbi:MULTISPECIES: trp RNA-binding attenuation protein MtrB [Synergistales]
MKEGSERMDSISGDFVVVRALEDGVTVIGLTRGHETRFAHSEKLDEGEVWISQFTELTSAMKVRGRAEILTAHGLVVSGRSAKGGKRSHEES